MHKIVENYVLYESIGAGQYGKVFRSKNTQTNEIVAVKTIPLQKFAQVPKLEEFTSNEIKTLARINNPNVVRFIEMLKTVNNMYLVYEFCEGGTLEDILQRKRFLPETEALNIFLQLLNAFKAIYKENILHRDLKPSNILIHNGVFKIADFGFCKKVSNPQELTFTMVGSPIYMAPEILKGFPYNIKGDIWSLGVVLYEMLFGVCPFEDKSLAGLIYQIDKKPLIFPREINNISKSTEELLRRMLVLDHRNRIDWNELLEYKIILPNENKTPILRILDNNIQQSSTTEKIQNAGNTNKNPTVSINNQLGDKDENKIENMEFPSVKVDLGAVNKYNEKLQQKAAAEAKLIQTLMKERNKIILLMNVVSSTLEQNIGNKVPVVVYLLLKKAYVLMESLRKEISIENSGSKFKNLESWEEFQITEEFLTFSRYLSEEVEEIIVYTAIVKREIETLLTANVGNNFTETEELIKSPLFETELLSNGSLNEKFFQSVLVSYIEELRDLAWNKGITREENGFTELMRHANEILDCLDLEEFFEKTMVDSGLKLEEQKYFTFVKNYEKEKLQHMVNEKLTRAKLRAA